MIYAGRGSSALWALLVALDRPGGRVLVPANICEIVVAVILKAGWQPVFCDVDPVTGNAGVAEFNAAWRADVAAVIAVPNFGTPIAMDEIEAWGRARQVFVIADICNALGATQGGRAIGAWGDAAIFSFGHAKIIEHRTGGAVTVNDTILRARVAGIIASMPLYSERHYEADRCCQAQLQVLRRSPERQTVAVYRPFYDQYADYLWYRIGQNDIDAIDAGRRDLEENLARRRSIAAIYQTGLRHARVRLRPVVPGDVYWRFTFNVTRDWRPRLVAALRASGVLVSTWYPPVPQLFVSGESATNYHGADVFGATVVNLFTDHRVDPAAAERAVSLINGFA